MNVAQYHLDNMEDYLEEFESFNQRDKPIIKKMKKEDKYTETRKQDKGKIREIKRNQENNDE